MTVDAALRACEARCGFWKSIAYATSGALVGVVLGAAPLVVAVFTDFVSSEDVVKLSPYANDKAMIMRHVQSSEEDVKLIQRDIADIKRDVGILLDRKQDGGK